MDKFSNMQTNLFTSLTEARGWVEKMKKDGCICPCCTQISKIYKRKLYSTMAFELIKIYKLTKGDDKDDFINIKEINNRGGGDFAKLALWELVVEKPKDPEETVTRTSGLWKITEKGNLFVQGKLNVATHVFLYNAKVLGFSETNTTIKEALGKKFNYVELMNGI